MKIVWQIILALAIPIGWGLLSAWLFDLWRARRHGGSCAPDEGGQTG